MIPQHFADRLLERYGIILSPEIYNELLQQVQQQVCVIKYGDGRELYEVMYQNDAILVLYDTNDKILVTALTAAMKEKSTNKFKSEKKKKNKHLREKKKTIYSKGKVVHSGQNKYKAHRSYK